jgi:S-DNA-T family DNA segregation ATPase FtsK/SpoIIIE
MARRRTDYYAPEAAQYGPVEWLRSHRVGLGPLYAAAILLPLGATVHLLAFAQAGLVLGAWVAACLFWVRAARGWRRPYYTIVVLVALAWLIAAHLTPSTWNALAWLLSTLAFAAVMLGIPWWSDHIRRVHVRMEVVVRDWRVRARRIGLERANLVNVKLTNVGWTGRLTWKPGEYSVDKVAAMRSELEGAFGLDVGELRMPPDGRSTSSVRLVAITDDPHAEAQPWSIPHTEVNGQLVVKRRSIKDLFSIGIREDGTIHKIRLWKQDYGGLHVMIGGITGSGKSGLLNLLWDELALCYDAVQWGMDLKGGVEMGPQRRIFEIIATSREQAVALLHLIKAEIERRQAVLEKRGERVWTPTRADPVIVISLDEARALLGNANQRELDMAINIATMGRALGIVKILATQYPTCEAIGSTQMREQFHHKIVFRMQNKGGEGFLFDEDVVDAHKINEDRPGTCYHKAGGKVEKMPIRVFWVDDATVRQLNDLMDGHTPTLSGAAVADLAERVEAEASQLEKKYGPEFAEPQRELINKLLAKRDIPGLPDRDESETGEMPIPEWTENDEIPLSEITGGTGETLGPEEREMLTGQRDAETSPEPAESARLSEGEAQEALRRALRAAGPVGLKVAELSAAATRGRTWTYEQLGALDKADEVARTTEGAWVWKSSELHTV